MITPSATYYRPSHMAPASATARPILAAFFFILLLSFLSHHVAAAFSFSFDFSSTSNYSPEDLMFEGDAAVNGGLVDLTCNPAKKGCMGRMSYKHPVFLYDNNTGELASFTTTFSFGIHMVPAQRTKGDGMTFFLSGYPSRLPLPEPTGDGLGLTSNTAIVASGADRFLAVEFDTYGNPFGERSVFNDYMGIDLNTVNSVKATKLPDNSLSGTMTATITFDNTTRTLDATLHFDDNPSLADAQVSAQLPDNLNVLLPREVAVGFSASTNKYYELHQIHSWSFNSTMASKETPIGATKEEPEQGQGFIPEGIAPALAPGATNFHPEQGQVRNTKGRHRRSLIIGGSVVLPSALLLSLVSILSWLRRTRVRNYFGKGSHLKQYKHRDLSIATDGFSDAKEIGRGEFGVVYKGRLEDKQVAVKRIHKGSRGEFKGFLAELRAMDGTGHVNLVRLEGWCCSLGNFFLGCCHRQMANLFLVYEFVPNGNLHQHLHEKPDVLSWEMRYKIVKGLCSAIHYLHHQCSPYILHRGIKPSNILLDNEFNAKLGDFGPSRAAQYSRETSLETTRDVVGTADYMDPLCKKNGGQVKLRRSSDIYSFGLVLLEIAHGENDLEGVRKLHRDQPETLVKAVADKKLAGKFFTKEMERVIVLGLRCSERDENRRPSLIGAMQFLENGGELPPATIHGEDNQRPSLIGAMQSLENGGELPLATFHQV